MKQLNLFKTEEELYIEETENFIMDLERQITKFETDDKFYTENNAFDWEKEFPQCCDENGNWHGFDVVIGNPPYIRVYGDNFSDLFIKYIKENYKTAYKKFDIYILFIEKSLQLLKKDGFLSFITPDKWLSQPYGEKIRNLLLSKNTICSISDLTKLKVFDKAVVSNVIFEIKKTKIENNIIKIRKFDTKTNFTTNNLPESFFEIDKPFLIDNNFDIKNLIEKINKKSIKLSTLAYVNWGCRPTPQNEFVADKKVDNQYKPLIVGSNISKYFISQNHRWVKYVKEMYNPLFKELFENETILFKDIIGQGNLTAALNTKNYYSDFTTINVLLWKETEKIKSKKFKMPEDATKYFFYDIKFILAIVNSKLISFYFNKTMKNGLHTLPNNVKNLPIILCEEKLQLPIINLINKILGIKSKNPTQDISDIEKEIDKKVYEIYGIDETEIQIIENK